MYRLRRSLTSLTGKPTTVAGYGITDASSASATETLTNKTINTSDNTITIVEADISDLGSYLTSVPAQSFTSLTGKPTTISGYGITDNTWANLSDKDGASGPSKIALGENAGLTTQGSSSVAIGSEAGKTNQGYNSVALGWSAGATTQGDNAVALGRSSSIYWRR